MIDAVALYAELHDTGVKFYPWQLEEDTAATMEMNGQYAVFIDFKKMSSSQELVTVAHEAGHCMTGSTHKLCSPFDLIARHENRANKWAIKKLIPKDELEDAMENGYTEPWSLAEYFSVTEDFIKKAVCLYTNGNLAVDYYCP